MNRLKNKLKNTRGASMIIALVFMLICLFVGGSVLVAATMNTQRIKHYPQHQVFMDRRSAAKLISDDLTTDNADPLRIIVKETIQSTQEVTIPLSGKLPNGPMPAGKKSYEFYISGGEDPLGSSMKRIVAECAVRNFIKINTVNEGQVKVYKVLGDGTEELVSLNNFWVDAPTDDGPLLVRGKPNGSVNVSIVSPEVNLNTEDASFNAFFVMDQGSNFQVYFKDVKDIDKPYGMLEVNMYCSTNAPADYTVYEEFIRTGVSGADGFKAKRVQTKYKISTIIWSDPVIEKGV